MTLITLCIMWKYLMTPLLNTLKTKDKLYFTILNYIPYYTLNPKLWIFIQINSKLNSNAQSIIWVIVYGAKHAFEKFKMQSVTWSIIKGGII